MLVGERRQFFSHSSYLLINFRLQDYRLCKLCKDEIGHEHEMEKFGLDLDEESSRNNLEEANPQTAHKHPLQAWIDLMPHAERCQDCSQTKCKQLKAYMNHAISCAHQNNGECMECSQLQQMYNCHAKQCNQTECVISHCSKYKQSIRYHRNLHRIKQEVTASRRALFITDNEEMIEC